MERTTEEHWRLVNWIAAHLRMTLERNRHKSHWSTMSIGELRDKLDEEAIELATELQFGPPDRVLAEALDVVAVAAFAADNARRRMEGEKNG